MSINTVSQRSVERLRNQHLIGAPTRTNHQNRETTGINRSPGRPQIVSVAVSDPGDSLDITLIVEDVEITVNTGTGLDASDIVLLFVDKINEDVPSVRAFLTPSASTSNLILTGSEDGFAFDVDDGDASLTATTTQTALDADSIAPGIGVVMLGYDSITSPMASTEPERLIAKATTNALVAQVDVATLVYESTIVTYWSITLLSTGVEYKGSIAMASNLTTSLDLLAAAINQAMPANTVLAANAGGTTLTLTAEVAGLAFHSSVGVAGAPTTARAEITSTTSNNPLTDINKALLGVSKYPYDEENTAPSTSGVVYPPNAGVRVLQDAFVCVENSDSVTASDKVYIELNPASANAGKFFDAGSATRLPVHRAAWQRALRNNTAELEIRR